MNIHTMNRNARNPALVKRSEKQDAILFELEKKEMRTRSHNPKGYHWACRTCDACGTNHHAHAVTGHLQNHWGHDFWIDFGNNNNNN